MCCVLICLILCVVFACVCCVRSSSVFLRSWCVNLMCAWCLCGLSFVYVLCVCDVFECGV